MPTKTEQHQDREANASNERLAVHVLALELMRNNTQLTMLEATERARRLINRLDTQETHRCSQ